MAKTSIPFVRVGSGGAETLALINVATDEPMSQDDIMSAITKMVTRWVHETDSGKEAWQESCHDFNIGDLFIYEAHFREWAFESDYPSELGILNIEFVFCADVPAWPFDMILVER